jgi:predicted transcriptional regulator
MICGILEIEIMNSIWTLTEEDEDRNIAVADIVEHLNSVNIERAYTTIKTVMDRLASKDLLVRYRNEKKFFYRSTLDREEVARDTLKEISNHFFKGNQVAMLRFIEKECECQLA